MKITIGGGTYTAEQRAIAREIVESLRDRGITVQIVHEIPPDPAHNIILRRLASEQFPIQVEVCDDAFDQRDVRRPPA